MMVPTIVVWVAGALTPANIAAIVAFLLMFIAPPFIIWIKQIHSCRGTEFGTAEGAAAQVLALALAFPDWEAAISGMVTTTDLMQSTEMRDYRIRKGIITQARMHSRNAASQKQRERRSTIDVILPHALGAAALRRTPSSTRRPPRRSTTTELLWY